MTDSADALARMPAVCATHHPSTHEPIVIKRGEPRHWPLPADMTIERVNTLFRARPAHVAAMLAGSMFGWDVRGADPSRYDGQGRPRRR